MATAIRPGTREKLVQAVHAPASMKAKEGLRASELARQTDLHIELFEANQDTILSLNEQVNVLKRQLAEVDEVIGRNRFFGRIVGSLRKLRKKHKSTPLVAG